MASWSRMIQLLLPKERLIFIIALLLLTSTTVIILQLKHQNTRMKIGMEHLFDAYPINRCEIFRGQQHKTNPSFDVKGLLKISSSISQRKKSVPAWKQYIQDFKVTQLYDPFGDYLTRLLDDLLYVEIDQISIFRHGTQLKFRIDFVDGNSAIAKPMITKKQTYVTYPKRKSFLTNTGRHTAEIAAFHLDRILNFRRVPPCTGRALNFTKDILSKTMDPDILDTQRTKDGAKCIIGDCKREFCNETALTCARKGLLEVSVCQSVPEAFQGEYVSYPWRQMNHHKWGRKNICQYVKERDDVKKYGLFLDFMDIAVFDHLLLNYARHSFRILRNKQNKTESGFALFNNGKGFGDPFIDDLTFLTPIKQCCQFRNATYQRVVQLTNITTKLSDAMRASLWQVPFVVLTEDFYSALDRRTEQVVKQMNSCIEKFGPEKVFSEK